MEQNNTTKNTEFVDRRKPDATKETRQLKEQVESMATFVIKNATASYRFSLVLLSLVILGQFIYIFYQSDLNKKQQSEFTLTIETIQREFNYLLEGAEFETTEVIQDTEGEGENTFIGGDLNGETNSDEEKGNTGE